MIEYRKWNDLGPNDRERILSNWDERLRDCSSMSNAAADTTDILYQGANGEFFVIVAKEIVAELVPRRIARLEEELKELRAWKA